MDINFISSPVELGAFIKIHTPDPEVQQFILFHLISISLRMKHHFSHPDSSEVVQESGVSVYIDDDVANDRPGIFFVYRFPKEETMGLFLVTKDNQIVDFYPLTEWPQLKNPE